jgi:hypothetical protein
MTNSIERRREYRRKALMGGLILARDTGATYDCLVRNLSAGGAQVHVANANWLPERFELDIRHRDLRIAARIVWRDAGRAGVAFLPCEQAPAARAG